MQISKLKIKVIIFIFAALVLASGCAKTVTVLPSVGNQVSLEITFRGNVDTAANKYYLVFNTASPLVPYKGIYIFAPGENYDSNKMNVSTDINYYYANYFASWSDFITLKNNTFTINNGPFIAASHTTYTPLFLSAASSTASNKITLVFNLSKLSAIPAYLYFNVICVDSGGYVSDYLRATDNYISTNQNTSIYNRVETQDPAIDSSLDITGWSMVIQ